MAQLILSPNFGRPGEQALRAYSPGDDFYEQLVEAHRGLDDASSELLNARLVLLLANHIGDLDVLSQALRAARAGLALAAEGEAAAGAGAVTAPAAAA